MENNPLLNWEDLPSFDRIETRHIEPGIRALLEGCEQAVARLEETSPRTWRELMDPLERIEDDLGRIWGIVSHLHGVKNSPELREVYDPLLAEVVKFGNRLGQSKPLYQAYCDLRDSEEARGFAPAQQRILESAIREAELNGVGLDDADRERYNEISQRLAELSTKFYQQCPRRHQGFQGQAHGSRRDRRPSRDPARTGRGYGPAGGPRGGHGIGRTLGAHAGLPQLHAVHAAQQTPGPARAHVSRLHFQGVGRSVGQQRGGQGDHCPENRQVPAARVRHLRGVEPQPENGA